MSNITASASLYANMKIQKNLMFFNLIQCKIVWMLFPSLPLHRQLPKYYIYHPQIFPGKWMWKWRKLLISFQSNIQSTKQRPSLFLNFYECISVHNPFRNFCLCQTADSLSVNGSSPLLKHFFYSILIILPPLLFWVFAPSSLFCEVCTPDFVVLP